MSGTPKYVESFGAVGDGKTDDTLAFSTAIQNCKYILGTPGKTYKINNLYVMNKQNITIDGQGSNLIFSSGECGIMIRSCSGSVFCNWNWIQGVSGAPCLIVDGGYQNQFRNIKFDNVPRCIWLRSSTYRDTLRESSLQNIYANAITEWAIWVGGQGLYGVHDVTYSDFFLTGNSSGKLPDENVGMLLDFAGMNNPQDLKGNHRMINILALGFATGFKFNQCNEAFVSNCQIDGCNYYGLRVMASVRMMFSNLWSSTIVNGPSIDISAKSKNVTISNAYCYNNINVKRSLSVVDESEVYLDGTVRLEQEKHIESNCKVYQPHLTLIQ
ncbi:hypothetical protein ABK040_015121 [Willaertia magna]